MAKLDKDINWVAQEYRSFLKLFNVTESNLRSAYSDWQKKQPAGSMGDFLWYILNDLLGVIGKQHHSLQQFHRLNIEVYKKMWHLLVYHENRNGNGPKHSMHENELNLWKLEAEWKSEVEIISGSCCSFCNDLKGKKLTFDEALNTQPLASKKCTREWGCNCCYTVTAVRGSNGRLIPL